MFAHSGVQHILCCVFLCIVYLILPVSLDFPYLIAPSVLSSVYFQNDIVFQNVFWIHIFYLLKQITYVFILKTKGNEY